MLRSHRSAFVPFSIRSSRHRRRRSPLLSRHNAIRKREYVEKKYRIKRALRPCRNFHSLPIYNFTDTNRLDSNYSRLEHSKKDSIGFMIKSRPDSITKNSTGFSSKKIKRVFKIKNIYNRRNAH